MLGVPFLVLVFFALVLQGSCHEPTDEPPCEKCSDVVYNDLRVTWRKKKSCPGAFDKLPRTECEAQEMGFRKLKCECSGSTLGIGYVKGNDTGLVMLYDVKGTVCGMQAQFRKRDLDKNKEYYPVDENEMFLPKEYEGKKYYATTIYFMNPKKICTEGRSEEDLEKGGTVQQLYVQNGKDPECDIESIPFKGEGFDGTTWVKGGCIPGMGSHYVRDYNEDFDCSHTFLFAPMFDENGCLLGISFGAFGYLPSSCRFDHRCDNYLKVGYPQPLPCCLPPFMKNTGGFTTMHAYFIDKPWEISCCS